ncbi:hypothetical protein EYF80_014589 [Liparis tanakae]|uniref:Uncharacterized protein n=1 Tax=Liparis tanakae TaxID=230148 RepID=A0A4Z2IAT4_9TELE|nr:hypothetical protein EYF80_014589 [Liparis tanakae]
MTVIKVLMDGTLHGTSNVFTQKQIGASVLFLLCGRSDVKFLIKCNIPACSRFTVKAWCCSIQL